MLGLLQKLIPPSWGIIKMCLCQMQCIKWNGYFFRSVYAYTHIYILTNECVCVYTYSYMYTWLGVRYWPFTVKSKLENDANFKKKLNGLFYFKTSLFIARWLGLETYIWEIIIIVAALIVHKIFELMYLYINKMRLKTKSWSKDRRKM